ncbi:MAG TPA: hypothetical protein VE242_09040 [Chthoniobacterales bacterium]|nr:hypothetical protein [Chthoniobacterales bacterium]
MKQPQRWTVQSQPKDGAIGRGWGDGGWSIGVLERWSVGMMGISAC